MEDLFPFKQMILHMKKTLIVAVALFFVLFNSQAETTNHPCLYVSKADRPTILAKIEKETWAKESWNNILKEIDPHVSRHQTDPQWIVSRLSMYWKEGERFTQCYIKNQNWDKGEGNAPIATVRLPGMRTWNDFVNVPLEDRIPYNESGDMYGISRSSADKTPVLIPYKQSGHMVRSNNNEILGLAQKAAFAFYVTQDEKYAKFSADILCPWLLGTYYMNPPLSPDKSTNGLGGYAPGGIMGYYDYEQIHDDTQIAAATSYDFLYDYLLKNPDNHLKVLNKSVPELAGVVFKRFIGLGLVRGGKRGNWNVNGFKNIINSMLILEPNSFYTDAKGRDYYIPYYTEKTTDYHEALPDFMKNFNPVTGLWPESPGYASGMIPTILNMGIKLYIAGINTFEENKIVQKAALANLGWLDARGNLVVFGDMRGGASQYSVFENLLTYYSLTGDTKGAKAMSTVIQKGIESGQYNRGKTDFEGICINQPLTETDSELPYNRAAYSKFHKHIIMKNGNDIDNGMMFTLYGGTRKSHLSENGLAMQIYGKGWALAPDAAAYESYWSKDFGYHQTVTGANTIAPGYTDGEIIINAMDPYVDSTAFYNKNITSTNCSFADVTANEKRRLVAMVRTSPTTGYYIDIFRSNQADNDYIYHNLGNSVNLKNTEGSNLELSSVNDLGTEYNKNYSYFKNQRKTVFDKDFNASWAINTVKPRINVDMWMMGQKNRELYLVDAPPTTIYSILTPGMVNKSPEATPTLIVRQKGNNPETSPFVAVMEAYNDNDKSIHKISNIQSNQNFVGLEIESNTDDKQKNYVFNSTDNKLYKPLEKTLFQGVFAIVSENKEGFNYLYLGSGSLLQKGKYSIEAVEGVVFAELRLVDGQFMYSADKPVKINVGKGKAKIYPAGSNLLVK